MRLPTLLALPLTIAPIVLSLAACGSQEPAPTSETPPAEVTAADVGGAPSRAVANLATADGKSAGTATALAAAEPAEKGIRLAVQVSGLTPGEHGVHVHTTGECDGPKFESAGSHWNPAGKQHGLKNPEGAHAGDMPNLTVGEDGRGIVNVTLDGGTIAELLDPDGAALMVHAKRDDQATDPSGDSGDRVACGVFGAS